MSPIPTGARFQVARKTEEHSKDQIIADIARFVGMQNIKEELNKLIALGELIALRRERDIPTDKIGLHMIFKGNPGTGKTALARELGKLFKAIGLLRQGQVIEVDRASLIGSHLGDAEKLVADAFERARHGVLFIDEAYALAGISAEGPTQDMDDVYAKAAIDTLLKMMEDHRSTVVVIVAGYPDPMDRFLRKNVGLKSRFPKTLQFSPYSYAELLEIFQQMVAEGHYLLDDDALETTERFVKTWDIKAKDFGNAREVRTFFEAILPAQAERISQIPNFKSLSDAELMTITAADVEAAAEAYGTRV